MHTVPNARRSTSALLYDENEKTREAVLDQQPLLGYTDVDDTGIDESWYRRIYTRYGLFRFSIRNILFLICSCCYMDLLRVSLFIYVTC
jgi:hypothetical protein